jgi:hypothetical protein
MKALAALPLAASVWWCGGFGASPPPTPTAPIGSPVTLTDRVFTVDAVIDHGDRLPDYRGFIADPDPTVRYVEVRFTEQNTSAVTTGVAVLPRLRDASGETHSGVPVGVVQMYLPRDANEYRWHDIHPGETLSFVAIYEVSPPTATGLTIEVGDIDGHEFHIPLGL